MADLRIARQVGQRLGGKSPLLAQKRCSLASIPDFYFRWQSWQTIFLSIKTNSIYLYSIFVSFWRPVAVLIDCPAKNLANSIFDTSIFLPSLIEGIFPS